MTALSRTPPFRAPLDHAGFCELFRRRHQADVDAIMAEIVERLRRLDDDDRLDDVAVAAAEREFADRLQRLADTFAENFISSAINGALMLERAAQ